MLVRNVRTVFNRCEAVLRNTQSLESRGVCINAIMNKSTEYTDIADVQAAALDNDMCILVDEKDNIIGSATKRECHRVGRSGNVPLHRAFSVLLFNTAGDLLLHKRSSDKVTYPNMFTNTCCSHPLIINGAPEDVKTAAIRRLNVELGIPEDQVKLEDLTFVSRFIYRDPGDGQWAEHELDHVLILQGDLQVNPNPDEIEEVQYVSKNNMDDFLSSLKDPVTPWFRLMVRHMLPLWWNNLHRLEEIAEHHKIPTFVNKL